MGRVGATFSMYLLKDLEELLVDWTVTNYNKQ